MKKFFGDTLTAGELMQAAVPYGHQLVSQDTKLTEEDLVMTSNRPGEWMGPIKDSGLAGHTCKEIASQMEIREVKACTPIIDKTVVEKRSPKSARQNAGVKTTAGKRRNKKHEWKYGGHEGGHSDVVHNGRRKWGYA